jgi:hypothetical protein
MYLFFIPAIFVEASIADKNTRLLDAAEKCNLPEVEEALADGADVNAVNNKGETALILTAKKDCPDIVKFLVKKGCMVSLKDDKGKSAWLYAVESENTNIVDLLERAGAVPDYIGREWDGYVSNQKEEFIKVVETQQEWDNLWQRAFDKPAPEMDFKKYVVGCVFLGYSAEWLYSIHFSNPFMRDERLVIQYVLIEMQLRLSGPFKAVGQYAMKVFEKKEKVTLLLEKGSMY